MFCPWCKNKIDDKEIYCSNCGKRIPTETDHKSVEKKHVAKHNNIVLKAMLAGVLVIGLGLVGKQWITVGRSQGASESNVVGSGDQISQKQISGICESEIAGQQEYKLILTAQDEENDRTYGDAVYSFTIEYDEDTNDYSGSLDITKNGKKNHVVTGENVDPDILTNGDTMFYITGDDSMVMTVHQYDLLSESEEIVFSEDTEEGLFLIGCYNEKLYYVLDQEMGVFCSFDLKHRKNERLAEDVEAGTVIQKGKYFYMHPYNGEDDLVASWLKVYDASTESVHTISNQLCELVSVEFINDEVYYLEYTVNTTYQTLPTTVRVRRCKADGSGQTTLIESLEVSDIIEITENAIRYLDKNEEEKIKSFVP